MVGDEMASESDVIYSPPGGIGRRLSGEGLVCTNIVTCRQNYEEKKKRGKNVKVLFKVAALSYKPEIKLCAK